MDFFVSVCSVIQSCLTVVPWTIASQAPLSMEFSRQENSTGGGCDSSSGGSSWPMDPTGILHFLHWQADSLPSHHLQTPWVCLWALCSVPLISMFLVPVPHFFFFLAVQGLHCHVGFSLVSVNGGFSLVHGLLIAMGSFVLKHRLQDTWASVLSAHGLSSCHSQILEHRLNSCGTWA